MVSPVRKLEVLEKQFDIYPRFSFFGDFPGLAKWSSGIMGPDRETIFCVPSGAPGVLAINTSNRSVEMFGELDESEPGTSLQEAGKWVGGVLGPDGKTIFCTPSTANTVLAIDTEERTLATFGTELLDTEVCKWAGSILGPDGITLYAIPSCAECMLSVNLQNRHVHLFGELPYGPNHKNKWSAGVLGADGVTIFGVPMNSPSVLAVNTNIKDGRGDPTLELIGNYEGTGKWSGGVFGPDGVTVFCIPLCAESVLTINTHDRTLTEFGCLPGRCKWRGGLLGPDKKTIFGVPACADSVLAIDTERHIVRTFGSLRGERDYPGWMWSGAFLAPDSLSIYCVPLNSNSILVIELGGEKSANRGAANDDDVEALKRKWVSVRKDHAVTLYHQMRPQVGQSVSGHESRKQSTPQVCTYLTTSASRLPKSITSPSGASPYYGPNFEEWASRSLSRSVSGPISHASSSTQAAATCVLQQQAISGLRKTPSQKQLLGNKPSVSASELRIRGIQHTDAKLKQRWAERAGHASTDNAWAIQSKVHALSSRAVKSL